MGSVSLYFMNNIQFLGSAMKKNIKVGDKAENGTNAQMQAGLSDHPYSFGFCMGILDIHYMPKANPGIIATIIWMN